MLTCLLLAAIAASGPSDALGDAIRAVMPTVAENRYLAVAWRTDLTAARREAQEQRKPVFLWIMNGHPLGCV